MSSLISHLPNGRLRYMLIRYARVSKADGSQSLDLQRDALREPDTPREAECENAGAGGTMVLRWVVAGVTGSRPKDSGG